MRRARAAPAQHERGVVARIDRQHLRDQGARLVGSGCREPQPRKLVAGRECRRRVGRALDDVLQDLSCVRIAVHAAVQVREAEAQRRLARMGGDRLAQLLLGRVRPPPARHQIDQAQHAPHVARRRLDRGAQHALGGVELAALQVVGRPDAPQLRIARREFGRTPVELRRASSLRGGTGLVAGHLRGHHQHRQAGGSQCERRVEHLQRPRDVAFVEVEAGEQQAGVHRRGRGRSDDRARLLGRAPRIALTCGQGNVHRACTELRRIDGKHFVGQAARLREVVGQQVDARQADLGIE
jgi:hypothetical protein